MFTHRMKGGSRYYENDFVKNKCNSERNIIMKADRVSSQHKYRISSKMLNPDRLDPKHWALTVTCLKGRSQYFARKPNPNISFMFNVITISKHTPLCHGERKSVVTFISCICSAIVVQFLTSTKSNKRLKIETNLGQFFKWLKNRTTELMAVLLRRERSNY